MVPRLSVNTTSPIDKTVTLLEGLMEVGLSPKPSCLAAPQADAFAALPVVLEG